MPDSKCLDSGAAEAQTCGVVETVGDLLMEGAMVAESNPAMRRRQLGMELRRLRDAADKTQDEAGEWTGLSATAVSKIERGKQGLDQGRLRLLMQFYNVGSPHAEALEQLRRESGKRGWWVQYGEDVPAWFAAYLGMETAAAEIWAYEPELIPGLLQTPEYVRAVTLATEPSADQADRFAAVRATRQKRLTDDDPLILRAVINEAVLRREVGGPEVFRAQLDRLAEAAALPNVSIRLLPFSTQEHPSMLGGFTCLRFPQEPLNVAYVEYDGGAIYIERPWRVERFADTFERLADLALTERETIEILDQEREGGI